MKVACWICTKPPQKHVARRGSRGPAAADDPCDFLDDPGRHAAVVDGLNPRLAFDGFELRTPRGCPA